MSFKEFISRGKDIKTTVLIEELKKQTCIIEECQKTIGEQEVKLAIALKTKYAIEFLS